MEDIIAITEPDDILTKVIRYGKCEESYGKTEDNKYIFNIF